MVYLGRPSRACGTCRKRRIKCDEAIPSCSYCSKKQLVCPGYRSQFDVAWRDQNVVAERSVRRRRNATERADRGRIAIAEAPVQTIGVGLSQDFGAYALNFFFSSYILLLPKDLQIQRSFLDCLYPVWVETIPTSPLRPAVTAVASCLLEAWSQMQPGTPLSLSRSQYLTGIAALRDSLRGTEDLSNDIIMASLMLDMYEGLISFLTGKPKSSPHTSGVLALMEHHGRMASSSDLSQRVLLGARHQIAGKALATKDFVPSLDLAQDLPVTLGTEVVELDIDVANLQASVTQLAQYTKIYDSSARSLLKKATELDQRLLTWEYTIPPEWGPIPVHGPECIPQRVSDAGLYQNHCNVYQNVFIAYLTNSYYCSRIKLQLAILTCLAYMNRKDLDSASIIALDSVQQLADTICASVPFHLGDRMVIGRIVDETVQYPHLPGRSVPSDHHRAAAAFGGWFLAMRLSELLSLGLNLRNGQHQWIVRQLQRIKNIYAIQS